jgi:hypothetical protein
MRKNRKCPPDYPLSARVWLATFDPAEVAEHLDEVDEDLLRVACRMANEWLYQSSSTSFAKGERLPVEKAMRDTDPEAYARRRLAFVRHVMSTVAGRYPELVENLMEV